MKVKIKEREFPWSEPKKIEVVVITDKPTIWEHLKKSAHFFWLPPNDYAVGPPQNPEEGDEWISRDAGQLYCPRTLLDMVNSPAYENLKCVGSPEPLPGNDPSPILYFKLV